MGRRRRNALDFLQGHDRPENAGGREAFHEGLEDRLRANAVFPPEKDRVVALFDGADLSAFRDVRLAPALPDASGQGLERLGRIDEEEPLPGSEVEPGGQLGGVLQGYFQDTGSRGKPALGMTFALRLASAARAPLEKRGGKFIMLWTIFVILLILWLLGLVSGYTVGGFIHILLVIAVVVLIIRLIQGRRVI